MAKRDLTNEVCGGGDVRRQPDRTQPRGARRFVRIRKIAWKAVHGLVGARQRTVHHDGVPENVVGERTQRQGVVLQHVAVVLKRARRKLLVLDPPHPLQGPRPLAIARHNR